MLLSAYRLIYLHPPKTAGNAIQKILLPNSDDEMVLSEHHDGVNRFEIKGALTKTKHADVSTYANALGREFPQYRVAISVRHPVDRALSLYFSPHRWFKKNDSNEYELTAPYWSEAAFESLVREMPTMCDFLRLDETIANPDFVIRTETLAEDFATFVRDAGLPSDPMALSHINLSADEQQKNDLMSNARVRTLTTYRFAEDFDFFGYEA